MAGFMAGVRVELLLVLLTGTLLLVSVESWEQIDASSQLGEPQSLVLPDDGSEYGEGAIYEDEFPEVEGAATSDDYDSFAEHGFQVDTKVSGPRNWASATDGGFQVEFVDALSRSSTSGTGWSSKLEVACGEVDFQITLPTGPLNEIQVLGSKNLSVLDAPESCGYKVNYVKNTLTVPFTGCNVKHADCYSLQLMYVNEFGQTQVATASCERSSVSDLDPFPRASGKQQRRKCSFPTTVPPTSTTTNAQTACGQGMANVPSTEILPDCGLPMEEQVTCGRSGISYSDCKMMKCCVDPSTSACYYPMDECTMDQNFVFAIRSNSASLLVDPTKLVIPGNTNCKPVFVNNKVAIFKFKVTECGVRAYEVGETKIYLAEVQTIVQALNLKYGIITRSDPLRFMVECRYSKTGVGQQSLASVGYMVKTPSSNLPSAVLAGGLYAVQLRIANDHTYSSYLPTYHQPLRLLLGNPVYLELSLRSPKPDAVILVNYCLAYPRSAKNALVLIYEGCANPYDPNVSILKVSGLSSLYQRRFVVKAFQFMDQKTNKYLDEEIYFMCSTEVCRPAEKPCEQQCFHGKASPGFAAEEI